MTSDITWPTIFPAPVMGMPFDVDGTVLRSTMSSGQIRQRRRFTQEIRTVGATWDLNDIQFLIFQSFYFDTLEGGAEWFNINLPMGDGFQAYVARFVGGKYRATNQGILNWKVSAQLEVFEANQLLSGDEIELAIFLYPDFDEFIAASGSFHELVHETLYGDLT